VVTGSNLNCCFEDRRGGLEADFKVNTANAKYRLQFLPLATYYYGTVAQASRDHVIFSSPIGQLGLYQMQNDRFLLEKIIVYE
jgi:hypothetical protein